MTTSLSILNVLIGVLIGYHLASAIHHDRMARGWRHLAEVARIRSIEGEDVIDAFGTEAKR